MKINDILTSRIVSGEPSLFIKQFHRLYNFTCFRDLLNVCLSLAIRSKVIFKIESDSLIELDHGHCKTLYTPFLSRIKDRIVHLKNYVITLKTLDGATIIHEIAHAVEQECEIDLLRFLSLMQGDIKLSGSSVMIRDLIKRLMIDELKNYHQSKIRSEIFARYFELLATTKEVHPAEARYHIKIGDVENYLVNLRKWREGEFTKITSRFISDQVHTYSTKHPPTSAQNSTITWRESSAPNQQNRTNKWGLKSIFGGDKK